LTPTAPFRFESELERLGASVIPASSGDIAEGSATGVTAPNAASPAGAG
jgi:hypothetical protein